MKFPISIQVGSIWGIRKLIITVLSLTAFTGLMALSIVKDKPLDPLYLGLGLGSLVTPTALSYMSEYRKLKEATDRENDGN